MISPNPNLLKYPASDVSETSLTGAFPIDFILEDIVRLGLDWIRSDEKAGRLVFGQLTAPFLNAKYGDKKITEILEYINKYDIKVVQHFSLIQQNAPCFSIQLLDGNEDASRAGLQDFLENVDELDESGAVMGRQEMGFLPVVDNLHIGIHAVETPDLVKYLYYFLIYVLGIFKPVFHERGLELTTFKGSDISRLNEYLPTNIYNRWVNFTVFTRMPILKGEVPIIQKFLGLNVVAAPETISGIPKGIEVNS